MRTGTNGIELIKHYEGLHDGDLSTIGLQPKLDPRGIVTVGWGHALRDPSGGWMTDIGRVKKIYPIYNTLTIAEADEILRSDLVIRENLINSTFRELKQPKFDALISFVYNCGLSHDLTELIRSERAVSDIVEWWESHYITSGGVVLNGLIHRRKTEAHLFATGELIFYN